MELLRQNVQSLCCCCVVGSDPGGPIRATQRLHPGEAGVLAEGAERVAPVGKEAEQSGEKGGGRKRSLLV